MAHKSLNFIFTNCIRWHSKYKKSDRLDLWTRLLAGGDIGVVQLIFKCLAVEKYIPLNQGS